MKTPGDETVNAGNVPPAPDVTASDNCTGVRRLVHKASDDLHLPSSSGTVASLPQF